MSFFSPYPKYEPLLGRAFKIEISKVSGSALVAEICTGPHNRLLRRQHCSSLCSQSEGHEHVANMDNALGHNFVGFSARAWSPQYSPPSLCEQSELQCFAPGLRQMSARCPLLLCRTRHAISSKNRAEIFLDIEYPNIQVKIGQLILSPLLKNLRFFLGTSLSVRNFAITNQSSGTLVGLPSDSSANTKQDYDKNQGILESQRLHR